MLVAVCAIAARADAGAFTRARLWHVDNGQFKAFGVQVK